MLKQLRKLNSFEPFFEEMVSMLSMEKLEEIFGIVIKKQKSDSSLEEFNLYKNGELIFAGIHRYEISETIHQLGLRVAEMASREATEDCNTEEVAKKIKEQENERDQYYICSGCGKRINRDIFHYHRTGED